eukprot:2032618-Rhodomonas_salina.1
MISHCFEHFLGHIPFLSVSVCACASAYVCVLFLCLWLCLRLRLRLRLRLCIHISEHDGTALVISSAVPGTTMSYSVDVLRHTRYCNHMSGTDAVYCSGVLHSVPVLTKRTAVAVLCGQGCKRAEERRRRRESGARLGSGAVHVQSRVSDCSRGKQ